MRKYTNMNDILKDIENNVIKEGDTIVLCEGKESIGMSSCSILQNVYLKTRLQEQKAQEILK